ncbi:TPA: methionine ABC transporter permease, partial [Neisseria gonorrhoeae]
MADLTFEQAVSTIVGMKDEIVRALGETFVMVGLSTTFAVIFGTLLGVLLFVTSSRQLHYNKPVNFLLDNLVNLMRAFPFVILMIAMIPATRAIVGSTIGPVAASLVLSVSGLFYFARLVEQNLREVPKGVIEAAAAMGAPPIAIVLKVLLNEARAGMVSSITVLAIGLLSYSAAA